MKRPIKKSQKKYNEKTFKCKKINMKSIIFIYIKKKLRKK
jgi:transcription elongation factor Elf1